MSGRKKSLKEAFSARAKAKNTFIEIANNKSSNKKKILESYKEYKKADDILISIYEERKYGKVA